MKKERKKSKTKRGMRFPTALENPYEKVTVEPIDKKVDYNVINSKSCKKPIC